MAKTFVWARDGFDESNDIRKEFLLKLELPLMGKGIEGGASQKNDHRDAGKIVRTPEE